jgi:hypothetical protein
MRIMPVLAAAMTVAAITMSAGAPYAAVAQHLRVQRNDSVEVLRLHANAQVTMEQALTQPELPPFVSGFTLDGQDLVKVATPSRD